MEERRQSIALFLLLFSLTTIVSIAVLDYYSGNALAVKTPSYQVYCNNSLTGKITINLSKPSLFSPNVYVEVVVKPRVACRVGVEFYQYYGELVGDGGVAYDKCMVPPTAVRLPVTHYHVNGSLHVFYTELAGGTTLLVSIKCREAQTILVVPLQVVGEGNATSTSSSLNGPRGSARPDVYVEQLQVGTKTVYWLEREAVQASTGEGLVGHVYRVVVVVAALLAALALANVIRDRRTGG